MERDRWHQFITAGVIASLVVSIVGIGIGVKALRKAGTTVTTVPAAAVLYPSSGATVSGTTALDARPLNTEVTTIYFLASGGSMHDTQIAMTAPTLSGWLAKWNTTTVSNGTYQLSVLAYDASGHSSKSPAVNVTVKNF